MLSKHNQPAKTLNKQKEAIRVINNAEYRDHTQPLLKKNPPLRLND
jgi:hypothetical protein